MLTDTAIRKAKPAEKAFKLKDERGLHLLVRPTGGKLWQLRFRHEGTEKTASLGQYPDVGLIEARAKRDELRRLIAQGVDPVAAKREHKLNREAARVHTFETVARTWFDHWKSGKSERHAVYVMARLEADVFPAVGTRPVAAIEAPELVCSIQCNSSTLWRTACRRSMAIVSARLKNLLKHGH